MPSYSLRIIGAHSGYLVKYCRSIESQFWAIPIKPPFKWGLFGFGSLEFVQIRSTFGNSAWHVVQKTFKNLGRHGANHYVVNVMRANELVFNTADCRCQLPIMPIQTDTAGGQLKRVAKTLQTTSLLMEVEHPHPLGTFKPCNQWEIIVQYCTRV